MRRSFWLDGFTTGAYKTWGSLTNQPRISRINTKKRRGSPPVKCCWATGPYSYRFARAGWRATFGCRLALETGFGNPLRATTLKGRTTKEGKLVKFVRFVAKKHVAICTPPTCRYAPSPHMGLSCISPRSLRLCSNMWLNSRNWFVKPVRFHWGGLCIPKLSMWELLRFAFLSKPGII